MAWRDWWRGAVVYEVYPRSYQDSGTSGVGDLAGITRRLPHIAALGVDAVWIAPFFTSPMADMGYDVADYRSVDPLFGTLADFDRLIATAHRLGLRVIIDQVLSHTSDRHPWFAASRSRRDDPQADWYVWADAKADGTAPNNWLSIFGGPAWEWDGIRMQYYMHSFLAAQPDLNLHNPAVQDALLETLGFWLDRGVDGFRLDAVNHYFHDARLRNNPPVARAVAHDVPDTNPYGFQAHRYDKTRPETLSFLTRVRALLDRYGARIAIGEVGDGDRSPATVERYTAGHRRLHVCYTFDLFGPEFSAGHIRTVVARFGAAAQEGRVCWAFSNHDVVRHVTRWSRGDPKQLAKLAIALLSRLPGVICLYQGEELGLPEAVLARDDLRDPYGIRFWPAFKGRDGCRTPMVWEAAAPHAGFSQTTPWLPIPDVHRALAVDRQIGDPDSVLAAYRTAIAFRKSRRALREGTIRFLPSPDGILAFCRESPDDSLLCVFNLSDQANVWQPPEPYRRPLPLTLPGLGHLTVDRRDSS